MACRRRPNLFRSMTAQSDRTHSRWRRISQRKLALLNHILDQAPIEGIDALKVQASSGKVLEARAGRGSWRLRSPVGAPTSTIRDGALPIRALLPAGDDDHIGEVLVWGGSPGFARMVAFHACRHSGSP